MKGRWFGPWTFLFFFSFFFFEMLPLLLKLGKMLVEIYCNTLSSFGLLLCNVKQYNLALNDTSILQLHIIALSHFSNPTDVLKPYIWICCKGKYNYSIEKLLFASFGNSKKWMTTFQQKKKKEEVDDHLKYIGKNTKLTL